MSSTLTNRRPRVCYARNSARKPKKGDPISQIQYLLEHESDWFLIYRYKSIASAIFYQRLKLFLWIFGSCFNVFLLAEVLIANLPAIFLLAEAFGVLFLISAFPSLRRSSRIVYEIFIDSEDYFIKARYITPWGVLRNRYTTKEDSNLLGSGMFLTSNPIMSKNFTWKAKDWNTSLEIPVKNFEIPDYSRAQQIFSNFDLNS